MVTPKPVGNVTDARPVSKPLPKRKGHFYRRRTPIEKILQSMAHIAEGNRISSLTRTTGHKEDTLLEWLKEAAEHVEAIESVLMADYQITRGQLDGLWAYVGSKGEKKAMPKPKRPVSSGVRP